MEKNSFTIGQVFHYLTVIDNLGYVKSRKDIIYKCQCKCGVIKEIRKSNLKSGEIKSCGCYMKERTIETSTTHGFASRGKKRSPEYSTWASIKARCYNPNIECYKFYGGRGIKMSDSFKESFLDFYNHVGPKPGPKYTIDRIDPNKNYEEGNIRWATWKRQARNKRETLMINISGVNIPVMDFCEENNLNRERFVNFIKKYPNESIETCVQYVRDCPFNIRIKTWLKSNR